MKAARKIGILGCFQESNSFSPRILGEADYLHHQGSEILSKHRGCANELGGIIAAAAEFGWELVPGHWFFGVSGGPAPATVWRHICEQMVRFATANPCEGWLVVLHGAMCAEDIDDVDGQILTALRATVGDGVPIVATCDPHAYITEEMLEAVDLLVPYQLFPHEDIALAGEKAVQGLEAILEQGWEPAMALKRLPVIIPAELHGTDDKPMADWVELCSRLTSNNPEIIQASFQYIQPWMNVRDAGWSVLISVCKQSDEWRARGFADIVAEKIMAEIDRFQLDLHPLDSISAMVDSGGPFPILLNQTSDSVGAGAPGDNTLAIAVLARLPANVKSVAWLVDPDSVEECFRQGSGATFERYIGGRMDNTYSAPLWIRGTIESLSDGRFTMAGLYMRGVTFNTGPTALVRTGGLDLLLCSKASMNADIGFYEAHSLDLESYHFVLIRSAAAFRSGFPGLSDHNRYLDTPGFSAANLRTLPFSPSNMARIIV